jgi:hypothetical protein
MITLKSHKGEYTVKVDGNECVFYTMWEALEFIYSEHSRRARASL